MLTHLQRVALLRKGPYAVQGVLAGLVVREYALPVAKTRELCNALPHARQ